MTDKSKTEAPAPQIDVLDQTAEICSATLDTEDSGVTFFFDGAKFVFGIFESGAGHVSKLTPECALAMGQAMQEAAILAHANVDAVLKATAEARGRVKH